MEFPSPRICFQVKALAAPASAGVARDFSHRPFLSGASPPGAQGIRHRRKPGSPTSWINRLNPVTSAGLCPAVVAPLPRGEIRNSRVCSQVLQIFRVDVEKQQLRRENVAESWILRVKLMRNKVLQKWRKIEDERRPQRPRREDRLFSRAGSVPPVPEFRRPHVRFSSLGSDDRGGCFVGPRYAAWVRPQGRLLSLVALDLEDVDVTVRPARIHGNTPGTTRDHQPVSVVLPALSVCLREHDALFFLDPRPRSGLRGSKGLVNDGPQSWLRAGPLEPSSRTDCGILPGAFSQDNTVTGALKGPHPRKVVVEEIHHLR
ncbi:hypothetical protein D4764_01G0020460 [Takifugu flavidus]|uniref:Uncharacterized protein n=1 Tax=Takifugu flavidus TaxID=433684 RepID=A0A5C6PTJ0_9TELE|nr:hypothetical protein D4764_01G0020460 [Takifugu flavidus]